MSAETIRLRQEIYRSDVEKMTEWLEDEEVVEYLNEDQNVHDILRRRLRHSSLPIFSAQFNQNGSFFVITHDEHGPIGFLRLVSKTEGVEMVVVIGERSQWGNGYGFLSVKKGLQRAFFDWREDQVIAKIHNENSRSMHVFKKAGFTTDAKLASEVKLSITIEDFL